MCLFIYFILEPAICQTFWKAANRYFMEVFNCGRYCMLYQIIFNYLFFFNKSTVCLLESVFCYLTLVGCITAIDLYFKRTFLLFVL